MNKAGRQIFAFMGWGVCGLISWYISLLIFSFLAYPFVYLVAKSIAPLKIEILTFITHNISFNIVDYVLAVLLVALLTRWFGFSIMGLFAFIIGAVGISLYSSIAEIIYYMNYYSNLPSWALSVFISKMFFIFILLPLSVCAGAFIGNRWRQKILFT